MTNRKSANLLLVDDDLSLLKLLGMRLSSEGFKVTTAESGPEALKILQKEKLDLVISDLRMDEMDGMALFDEIQKPIQTCQLSYSLLMVLSLMPSRQHNEAYLVFN